MPPVTKLCVSYENPDTSHATRTLYDEGSYYFHLAVHTLKTNTNPREWKHPLPLLTSRLARWLKWRDSRIRAVRRLDVIDITHCISCPMHTSGDYCLMQQFTNPGHPVKVNPLATPPKWCIHRSRHVTFNIKRLS